MPLWKQAQAYHPNRGSLEEVLKWHPKTVLSMGGGGRATSLIARRLESGPLDLRPAGSLDDVGYNFRAVAAASASLSGLAPGSILVCQGSARRLLHGSAMPFGSAAVVRRSRAVDSYGCGLLAYCDSSRVTST